MKRITAISLAVTTALAFTACSKNEESPTLQAPAPVAAAPAAASTVASPPAASSVAATAAPTGLATAMTRAKAPDGATASFVGIKNGDTVTSPFKVSFGAAAIKIAPAGTTDPGTGHFHLIVDADLPSQDAPLPANEHVMHFGKGQMDTDLTLPAGTHTLQLEITDGNHLPFDPPVVSDKITVTVK